jgi:hypothetical protein
MGAGARCSRCVRRRSTPTCTCSRRSSRAPCAKDCSHATPPKEKTSGSRSAARRSTASSSTRRCRSSTRRASSISAPDRRTNCAAGSSACARRARPGRRSPPTRHRRINRHLPRKARRRAANAALPPSRRDPHARGPARQRAMALNCEHVDLARRELRVLDAKTPAGVRRVDIHDDLQEELAAYKAARGEGREVQTRGVVGRVLDRRGQRRACPSPTG